MLQDILAWLNQGQTARYYFESLMTPLLNLVFAWAVFKDARSGAGLGVGKRPWLVSAWVWALAVLAAGWYWSVLYWMVHHSALRSGFAPKESGDHRRSIRGL